jgi:hypothetical protein
MRVQLKAIVFTLTILLLVVPSPKAHAEEFLAGDVIISWGPLYKKPDNVLFADINFSIRTNNLNLQSIKLDVTNKFGDNLTLCSTAWMDTSPPSTATSCRIVGGVEYTDTVLNVEILTKSYIRSIYKTPITFLDRNAKPISQPKESIASNDDLESLKEQIRVLTAKINKICKVKPKPRGC